jgi:hypothetical protein
MQRTLYTAHLLEKPKMRSGVLVLVMFLSLDVLASECGPLVTQKALQPFIERLDESMANLIALERGIDVVSAMADDLEVERRTHLQTITSYAYERGHEVLQRADIALLLTQVKSDMVDQRDIVAVDRYLSVAAVFLARSSARSKEFLNAMLQKFTAPTIALEISRLRDTTSEMARQFASCEPPSTAGSKGMK